MKLSHTVHRSRGRPTWQDTGKFGGIRHGYNKAGHFATPRPLFSRSFVSVLYVCNKDNGSRFTITRLSSSILTFPGFFQIKCLFPSSYRIRRSVPKNKNVVFYDVISNIQVNMYLLENKIPAIFLIEYLTFWTLAVSLRTTRFNIQKFYMVLALRLLFCTDIRTHSDFCFIHH